MAKRSGLVAPLVLLVGAVLVYWFTVGPGLPERLPGDRLPLEALDAMGWPPRPLDDHRGPDLPVEADVVLRNDSLQSRIEGRFPGRLVLDREGLTLHVRARDVEARLVPLHAQAVRVDSVRLGVAAPDPDGWRVVRVGPPARLQGGQPVRPGGEVLLPHRIRVDAGPAELRGDRWPFVRFVVRVPEGGPWPEVVHVDVHGVPEDLRALLVQPEPPPADGEGGAPPAARPPSSPRSLAFRYTPPGPLPEAGLELVPNAVAVLDADGLRLGGWRSGPHLAVGVTAPVRPHLVRVGLTLAERRPWGWTPARPWALVHDRPWERSGPAVSFFEPLALPGVTPDDLRARWLVFRLEIVLDDPRTGEQSRIVRFLHADPRLLLPLVEADPVGRR